jgi:hypothetical protein
VPLSAGLAEVLARVLLSGAPAAATQLASPALLLAFLPGRIHGARPASRWIHGVLPPPGPAPPPPMWRRRADHGRDALQLPMPAAPALPPPRPTSQGLWRARLCYRIWRASSHRRPSGGASSVRVGKELLRSPRGLLPRWPSLDEQGSLAAKLPLRRGAGGPAVEELPLPKTTERRGRAFPGSRRQRRGAEEEDRRRPWSSAAGALSGLGAR